MDAQATISGSSATTMRVAWSTALYALVWSTAAFGVSEDQTLRGGGRAAFDFFGGAVAVSGDTAVVGATGDDPGGSAYIFERTGGLWREMEKLQPAAVTFDDAFGLSVAIADDVAVVGAPGDDTGAGLVYVFVREGPAWVQADTLTVSDRGEFEGFGESVSVSGDTILVGAGQDDNGDGRGAAYTFVRQGEDWIRDAILTASDSAEGDFFGDSVALSGDTAIIGARGDDDRGDSSGSAYVFVRNGTEWIEQQKLAASDGGEFEFFGLAVAIAGNTAIVSAPGDSDGGLRSGSAYVFELTGGVWTEQQKLTASDAAEEDSFGESVTVSGTRAVVGALRDDDGGDSSGSAYVFERSDAGWTESAKLTASDADAQDFFGESVSISGDTVFAGAVGTNEPFAEGTGTVYVFETPSPPNAVIVAPLTPSPTNAGTVSFLVSFDEDVQGFDDAADLIIAHSGTANAGVTITGGPAVYTVDLTGVTGNGSFTLAASTSSDIGDAAGTPLASSATSAPIRVDTDGPTIAIGPPSATLASVGPVTYIVSYGGADSISLVSADIDIIATNTAAATAQISGGIGSSDRTVSLTGITGDGTLAIAINRAGTAIDVAGNEAPAAGPSATVTVDTTAPTFSNVVVTPLELAVGETITIAFVSSESIDVDPVVTINGNAAIRTAKDSDFTYTYTVASTDPVGTTAIEIMGMDPAGNAGTLVVTDAFTVSQQGPPILAASLAILLAIVAVLATGGGLGGGLGDGGGGPCFIATAAYGTPLANEVAVLRDVRDEFLLSNGLGTAFVDVYYSVSPPIADLVAAHPSIAVAVRLVLLPLVVAAQLFLASPVLVLPVALAIALAYARRRSYRSSPSKQASGGVS